MSFVQLDLAAPDAEEKLRTLLYDHSNCCRFEAIISTAGSIGKKHDLLINGATALATRVGAETRRPAEEEDAKEGGRRDRRIIIGAMSDGL